MMSRSRQVPPGHGFGKFVWVPYSTSPLPPPESSFVSIRTGVRVAGRGHLRQEAGDVLPPGGVLRAARPVRVEDVAVDDPALAGLLEAEGHVRPDEVHVAPDEGVDVGVDRLRVGRHEDPRAGRAHLVLVEPDLREPLVVDGPRDGLRLLLREHEPVAVVVVAHVVVVEPRHPPALVLRAEVLPVPLGLHHQAVGIEGGDEEEHHLVQPPPRLRVLRRGQRVRPLHRHLRRADLGRMDVAGDEEEDLPLADEGVCLRLGEPPGVGDLPGDLLEALLARDVRLGRDRGKEEVLAERRLAEDLDLDPRRGRVERLEVGEDLPVVGHRPVGPDRHSEEGGGRGDGRGLDEAGDQQGGGGGERAGLHGRPPPRLISPPEGGFSAARAGRGRRPG